MRSCSDFRAFFDVSRLCNFDRVFIFGLDILASVWDLNLGDDRIVIVSVCAPPRTLCTPVNEHVLLHSKTLCKILARVSVGF